MSHHVLDRIAAAVGTIQHPRQFNDSKPTAEIRLCTTAAIWVVTTMVSRLYQIRAGAPAQRQGGDHEGPGPVGDGLGAGISEAKPELSLQGSGVSTGADDA